MLGNVQKIIVSGIAAIALVKFVVSYAQHNHLYQRCLEILAADVDPGCNLARSYDQKVAILLGPAIRAKDARESPAEDGYRFAIKMYDRNVAKARAEHLTLYDVR